MLFCAATVWGQTVSPLQTLAPKGASPDALTFSKALPAFDAIDLNGRSWRTADLLGKVTVVQIWGVFCLPCRQEHPMLQEFFRNVGAIKDVQVLTFSLDEGRSQVAAYMREKGFTFPVIVDGDLERKLFPNEGGIPKTWVIGPKGERTEAFRTWSLGRVLLEVEKVARGK
jgi:thiol-disulfide isomerase/thioredoxin